MIERLSQRYYDKELAPFGIGAGQYLFLLWIHEHPGITGWELADKGKFDKGTVTKSVQKMEQLGYVTSVVDANDRRLHRLYLTCQADEIIEKLFAAKQKLDRIRTENFSREEVAAVQRLLEKMAENMKRHVCTPAKHKDRSRG